jgi:ferritin-like metal-binding protein YciE
MTLFTENRDEHVSRVGFTCRISWYSKSDSRSTVAAWAAAFSRGRRNGVETIAEEAEPDVMDTLPVEAAQRIEYREIATYGTLCTRAEELA